MPKVVRSDAARSRLLCWGILCLSVGSVPAIARPGTGTIDTPETLVVSDADLFERASLEGLVRYAIEHNPSIRSARFEWEAARERIRSESWYDDPTITYKPDTGATSETRGGPLGNGLELSQAVPFPGKLTLLGRIASAQADATYQILEATIQDVTLQVRMRYADYYLAARSLQINSETIDLTQQFADIAEAKYRVGTAAQQDVILAEEQLSRLAAERVVLQGSLAIAVGDLNALLDRAPRAPIGPPRDLSTEPLDVPLELLIDAAVRDRPELRSQDHIVEARKRSVKLARMGFLPDFKLAGQWTEVKGGTNPTFSRDGRDIWTVKIGLSIPIWFNRIDAEVDEMRARVSREEFRRRDLENQVLDQVQRQFERVRVAWRTEDIYRRTLIPQTSERIAAARAGYQTGLVDFLTLIDSVRSLEEVRLERDRTVRDYQQAIAGLERAIGRPLSEVAQ